MLLSLYAYCIHTVHVYSLDIQPAINPQVPRERKGGTGQGEKKNFVFAGAVRKNENCSTTLVSFVDIAAAAASDQHARLHYTYRIKGEKIQGGELCSLLLSVVMLVSPSFLFRHQQLEREREKLRQY